MAIIDVVRFDGLRNRDWFIYKYPSDQLVMGTQLIVQEGQIALFVRNGIVADMFYPGAYTLATENLPILRTFVNLPFGGRTPFSAEVYFINTTTRLDVNWGTIDPIQLVDPKYYVKLRVRAFGQMGLQLSNPTTFFKGLIGGMQQADVVKMDKIKEYFRGIIAIKAKSAIADAIITNGTSALEISTQLEKLSDYVRQQILPAFDQWGLTIANFYIQSINFPDEDFEKINKILENKAAFEIMGNQRYMTQRSMDIYESAAQNPNGVAGAFAAGGMGIGMAANLGSTMNQVVQPPVQAAPPTKTCVSCGATISANCRFCPECGADNQGHFCECGYKLVPGTKFCSQCGKKVSP